MPQHWSCRLEQPPSQPPPSTHHAQRTHVHPPTHPSTHPPIHPPCLPHPRPTGRLLASHGADKDWQLAVWSPASGRLLGKAREKGQQYDVLAMPSEDRICCINRTTLVGAEGCGGGCSQGEACQEADRWGVCLWGF